jgi:hypothetical protein
MMDRQDPERLGLPALASSASGKMHAQIQVVFIHKYNVLCIRSEDSFLNDFPRLGELCIEYIGALFHVSSITHVGNEFLLEFFHFQQRIQHFGRLPEEFELRVTCD